jgi:hypothetical protein
MDLVSEENFIEYGTLSSKSKKEYFCTKCVCVLIESFKDSEFYSSDWIDFNG